MQRAHRAVPRTSEVGKQGWEAKAICGPQIDRGSSPRDTDEPHVLLVLPKPHHHPAMEPRAGFSGVLIQRLSRFLKSISRHLPGLNEGHASPRALRGTHCNEDSVMVAHGKQWEAWRGVLCTHVASSSCRFTSCTELRGCGCARVGSSPSTVPKKPDGRVVEVRYSPCNYMQVQMHVLWGLAGIQNDAHRAGRVLASTTGRRITRNSK